MASGTRRYETTEGAVAITVAITLSVLLLFAALAIDLGLLRTDRAASQLVADMAASAAVQDHVAAEAGSSREACEQAKAYAEENLGRTLSPIDGEDDCDVFPSDGVCDADAPLTARYEAGPYTIEIVNPVPDGSALMHGEDYGQEVDANPCDRVGVSVERTRNFFFAGIGGSEMADGEVGADAVAKGLVNDDPEDYASLVILEREACETLANTGGGVFRVLDLEDGDGKTYPGTVTVDSLVPSGGCNKKIIDASTSTGSVIEAESGIFAHALEPGGEGSDPENQDTYPTGAAPPGGDNLLPAPEPGPIITRALVDHQYNCLPGGYDDPTPAWSPLRGDQPIDECPDSAFEKDGDGNTVETEAPPPYLKELDDRVQVVVGADGDDWTVIEGDECEDSGVTHDGGSYLVRCDATFGPDDVTFQDADHVIFENGLEIGTGDHLKIYGDGDDGGTTVTMYSGGLESDGGRVELKNVFTYIRSTDTNKSGRINVTGSTDRFSLKAMTEDDGCAEDVDGAPNAACFAPLAVWSNYIGGGGNSLNRVAGNAAGGIIGTVFTPNSTTRFRGSGDDEPSACGSIGWDDLETSTATLKLEGAQFFARKVDIAGTAAIGMCPSPDTTLPTNPERIEALIR